MKCRIVSASTVVSADSRPLRGRQSGHFLETASLHPPLAALRRFPAPLPLTVRNAGVHGPYVFGPSGGAQASAFQTGSGNGAAAETILNLGINLPNPYLPTGKGSQETMGFWRAFGYFSRTGKVPRRRRGQADSTSHLPVKNKGADEKSSAPAWELISLCRAYRCTSAKTAHC